MRKVKLLLVLAVLFASLFVGTQVANAAEITSSKYENNRISLTGTGDTQVEIVLFGLDNSPLYMTTAAVENGKFSITLPEIANLKDGNYTIKVGNYDGKNVSSKVITVKSKNLKTGDESVMYLSCALLSILSGAGLVLLFTRKNVKKAQ